MREILICAFFGLLVAGCATAYQAKSFTGGFSETRLGDNVFEVNFRGNGYTSRERARDFALLRSSEVTLESGYRYFAILDSDNSASLSSYTTPTHTQMQAYSTGNYAYGTATTTGGQTHFVSKPTNHFVIMCFEEKPDQALTFDARFVAAEIRKKYGIE